MAALLATQKRTRLKTVPETAATALAVAPVASAKRTPAAAPVKDKKKQAKIPLYLMGAMLSLFGCSIGLYFHTVLVESQANETQREIITMKEQNDKLQATLAELKTLPAVEIKATELGMQPVQQFHYISMPASTMRQPENTHQVVSPTLLRPQSVPSGF